jgi:ferredoxin--NADP+ reductase
MAYVIAAPCVADYSCVEVCPVDCIAPDPDDVRFDVADQLFIDPARCINCAACIEACPVNAIFDEHRLPSHWAHYAQVNAEYFAKVDNG